MMEIIALTVIALGLSFLVKALQAAYKAGIRSVPGPSLARFSRIPNLLNTHTSRVHEIGWDLHNKYGPVVRIGPWHVSVSDPKEISTIYGVHSKFTKSEFYDPFTARLDGVRVSNLFSERDRQIHSHNRSLVSQIYSLSSLKTLEPLMEECSEIFFETMRADAGKPVDLGVWLQFYAFDVIGMITFSQRFGFMEQRKDIDGIMATIKIGSGLLSRVGQIPLFYHLVMDSWWMRSIMEWFPNLNPTNFFISFTRSSIAKYDLRNESSGPTDMLSWFRRQQAKNPTAMTDTEIFSDCFANITAGSDTTAITLRAIIYYIVKNPRVHTKLINEIQDFDRRGLLSSPFVKFDESLKMPYLQAVIKESMRVHPAFSFPLERLVPPGPPVKIGGYDLPAGTVVGMNPWVVHRNHRVFGEDAMSFRPERWIDSSPEQLNQMERSFLSFGAGSRTCLGKNISLLEIGKLVPQLLRVFEIEWSGPRDGWTLDNEGFLFQRDCIFTLKERLKESTIQILQSKE